MPDPDPSPRAGVTPREVGLTYNAKLGLWMFAFYCLLYGGFVAICAIDYRLMATPVFAGVNLAIVYGMGLIGAAVVLAIVYMLLCRDPATELPDETEQ